MNCPILCKNNDSSNTSSSKSKQRETLEEAKKVQNEARGYYFEGYSFLQAHESMIKDNSRTLAYKRAIEMNKHLFKDKIVLDVGCGLGILSLFAAAAGAKTVIGIDASDITDYAEKVIRNNHFTNIFILKSKVEEIEKLPADITQVDIIISEWMGVCLYHESMLGTVLYARDKWLKPNGLMFPDKVKLFLGCFDESKKKQHKFDNWSAVYGYNMSTMLNVIYGDAFQEILHPNQIVTNFTKVSEVDLYTASAVFSFSSSFEFTVKYDCSLGGFFTFFEAIFTKCHKPVVLSTSPLMPATHWRQTLFYLYESLYLHAGEKIKGKFSLHQFKYNFRDLEIRIKGEHYDRFGVTQAFCNDFILR